MPTALATPVTTTLALAPIAGPPGTASRFSPTQWVGQATIVAGIQLRR